jgi:predicted aldo/keto reductase-like oxidoreductase
MHHFAYSSMTEALRKLCGRGSAVREKVVLATVTYIKHPDAALSALFDQFSELGIDYVDVFFWGWVDESDRAVYPECLKLSHDMRGPNTVYQRTMERLMGASEKLKKMGAVRYVGTSFHSLQMAKEWSNSPLLDVVMVRHNPAHRTAQDRIFQKLQSCDPNRPGIVTFKSVGLHTGQPLWNSPAELPEACVRPTVPDFYRYSLSQNCVDVCLTGPQFRREVDAALDALQKGKLSPKEIDYLNIYGDLHRGRIKISEVSQDRLLYQS